MSIKSQIFDDIKGAMKSKDSKLLTILRTISAAIKQKEIDTRLELTDAEVGAVISKHMKQLLESQKQFVDAKRDDLVEKVTFEISVVEKYLPKMLSEEEMKAAITKIISEVGAKSKSDMGKVMGALKKSGLSIDMKKANELLTALLG